MKTKNKAIAGVLASSLLLSFAGCNKGGAANGGSSSGKSRSGEKISADDPWFDAKQSTVDCEFDTSRELEAKYSSIIGQDDKYLIVEVDAYYKTEDYEDYSDYYESKLQVLDINTGDIVNTVDMKDILSAGGWINEIHYADEVISFTAYEMPEGMDEVITGEDVEDITGEGATEGTDETGVEGAEETTGEELAEETGEESGEELTGEAGDGEAFEVTDNQDGNDFYDVDEVIVDDYYANMTVKKVEVNVMTGEVLKVEEVEEEEGEGDYLAGGYQENSFTVGDYTIDTVWYDGSNDYYQLKVYSPDKSFTEVDIKDAETSYYNISMILPMGDTKALVPVSTESGDFNYFELDLSTLTATKVDNSEYAWLEEAELYGSQTIGSDGRIYVSQGDSVVRINMESKTVETVFDFNDCGVSMSTISYLELITCSEDSFVFAGTIYDGDLYSFSSVSDFKFLRLDRAATNPHAGKTIIEMFGYMSDGISDAVLSFNEANENYYIICTDRYSDSYDGDYSEINSDDDLNNLILSQNQDLSNELAMDIMNGDGPDILLNVAGLAQLNNSDYLADLTPYVGDLDSQKYFTNVIEASKIDGKLYQLPLSFSIKGIQTNAKYAGASGVGFTVEEYEEFLKSELNGTDVITNGQAMYFVELFNAMSEKFVSNGKVDFSGPEFEKIANFVKDYVPETSRSWDDYSEDDDFSGVAVGANLFPAGNEYSLGIATYGSVYSISSYFDNLYNYNEADSILGVPSADGRGPLIEANTSIAISAQTKELEACGEFIKYLINDDVMKDLASYGEFVISRDAFQAEGTKAIEAYNGEYGEIIYGFGMEGGLDYSFSQSDVDKLEEIINNCSAISSSDADINLVLIEDMPAFFSGQKELADVVKIAEDRAQKVLDERG